MEFCWIMRLRYIEFRVYFVFHSTRTNHVYNYFGGVYCPVYSLGRNKVAAQTFFSPVNVKAEMQLIRVGKVELESRLNIATAIEQVVNL